jgi:hypothetical protein
MRPAAGFVPEVLVLVPADAVHEVVQVSCGEFPAERPGGLVAAGDEAQQVAESSPRLAKYPVER